MRAVPTNAELKMERALDVFNASDHVRTVGGVARSLGAPEVCVRPLPERPSVVAITVMWELSWYRFQIDLGAEHQMPLELRPAHDPNDYEIGQRHNLPSSERPGAEVDRGVKQYRHLVDGGVVGDVQLW